MNKGPKQRQQIKQLEVNSDNFCYAKLEEQ